MPVVDLFDTKFDSSLLSKNFKAVRDNPLGFSGAIRLVNEIYNSTKQIDADFEIQFQTNGFDARIWELYLLATFQEFGFGVIREKSSPDFELVLNNKKKVFVEAVTSNPKFNMEIEDKLQTVSRLKDEDIPDFIEDLRKTSLIKIAGALFNKYNKKYWELDWVKGHPLILAVEAFHHSFALDITDSSLVNYLYGFDNEWYHDKNGKLIIKTLKKNEHTDGHKTIPSNFFSLPGAENISAVIFSNSGTISKFNRMAKLKGYGEKSLTMVREGTFYDHNPNAVNPLIFKYIVGLNGPTETWREGLSIYHNPNAINQLSKDEFPGILNGFYEDYFYSYVPDFHPYQSITTNYVKI